MTEQHIGPAGPTDEQIEAQGLVSGDLPASEAPAGPPPSPPTAPAVEAEVVEEWNPLASLEVQSHEIPSSGGRAAVLLRPWAGAERISYEDQLLIRFLIDDDGGNATVRLGMMRLVATSLTLRGSTGFPARGDGSAMFSGNDKTRVETELLSLDPNVYQEIRDLALKVQPLPRQADTEPDDGDGDGEGSDPFPTPPTPATEAPAGG